MIHINCYCSSQDKFSYTICALLEKYYSLGYKILIVVPNDELLLSLDSYLWTYSDKFVPHGVSFEIDSELQPILFSTELLNKNRANTIFFVNPKQELLSNFFSSKIKEEFLRIVFVFDQYIHDSLLTLQNLIVNNFPMNNIQIKFFSYQNQKWTKIKNI